MKKIITLLAASVMALSLAACGGEEGPSKKAQATDAFNSMVAVYDATAELVNENLDVLGDNELIASYTELSEVLLTYKEHLESDEELTDEEYDEMIAWCEEAEVTLTASKAGLEDALEQMNNLSEEDQLAAMGVAFALGTWDFCGGYVDGAEMNQEEMETVLAQYGGVLQLQFNEDGSATMTQGGGALTGELVPMTDVMVGAIFNNNGTDLEYVCELTSMDGNDYMLLTTDGETYLYFVKVA